MFHALEPAGGAQCSRHGMGFSGQTAISSRYSASCLEQSLPLACEKHVGTMQRNDDADRGIALQQSSMETANRGCVPLETQRTGPHQLREAHRQPWRAMSCAAPAVSSTAWRATPRMARM